MFGDSFVQELTEKLNRVKLPLNLPYFSRSSLERTYQCVLYKLAEDYGCIPIPEMKLGKRGQRHRYVDMVWIDSTSLTMLAAFELDGTLKRRDIYKLGSAPASFRVFVNLSDRPGRIKSRLIRLENEWINLSNAFIICPRLSKPFGCKLTDAYKYL